MKIMIWDERNDGVLVHIVNTSKYTNIINNCDKIVE